MNTIAYQILFLFLCIGVGWWINRRSFTGFIRYVNGIPLPSYIVAAALSIFVGLLLWGFLNFLIFKFH